MKERPILMNGAMVRAVLEGRKTQTRRIVKPQPETRAGMNCTRLIVSSRSGKVVIDQALESDQSLIATLCPYGLPGDRLYVRETFLHEKFCGSDFDGEWHSWWGTDGCVIEYAADGSKPRELRPGYYCSPFLAKRPAIHMPRWASRIDLEITGVRVERLHEISVADAMAEGLRTIKYKGESFGFDGGNTTGYGSHTGAFRALWESINGAGSWDLNPFVWAIEFKRAEK